MTHLSLEVKPFETKLLIALPEEQIFQQSPQVGVVGPILKTQAAAVVQVGRLGCQIGYTVPSGPSSTWSILVCPVFERPERR